MEVIRHDDVGVQPEVSSIAVESKILKHQVAEAGGGEQLLSI